MTYEDVKWTDRFIVCGACGCMVLLWKTDVHDRACPAKIREPMRAEVRILP
jgi:hypothetical protein